MAFEGFRRIRGKKGKSGRNERAAIPIPSKIPTIAAADEDLSNTTNRKEIVTNKATDNNVENAAKLRNGGKTPEGKVRPINNSGIHTRGRYHSIILMPTLTRANLFLLIGYESRFLRDPSSKDFPNVKAKNRGTKMDNTNRQVD